MRNIIIIVLVAPIIFANNAQELASRLELVAGSKATVQWERVFSSERRKKKYHINTLSSNEIENLKKYLIKHAADSDQPIVPGL